MSLYFIIFWPVHYKDSLDTFSVDKQIRTAFCYIFNSFRMASNVCVLGDQGSLQIKRQIAGVQAANYNCMSDSGLRCCKCNTFACYECVRSIRSNISTYDAVHDFWCIFVDENWSDMKQSVVKIPTRHCCEHSTEHRRRATTSIETRPTNPKKRRYSKCKKGSTKKI